MKKTPMLMRGGLAKATLAGVKTQTRRLNGLKKINVEPDRWKLVKTDIVNKGKKQGCFFAIWRFDGGDIFVEHCPYGGPEDEIWVREAWRTETSDWDALPPSQMDQDFAVANNMILYDADADWRQNKTVGKSRPSIHMPAKFSRLTLRIREVDVQRIQDINGKDCCAEGVRFIGLNDGPPLRGDMYKETKQKFTKLWNLINPENNWSKNPWVWVIKYKMEKNV